MNNIRTYFFHRFNTFSVLILTSLVGLMLLMLRVKFTHSFFLIFMVWNLFLAFVPFVISSFLRYRLEGIGKWTILFWGSVWLLFLPNAPYMVTDLIHLISKEAILWFDPILILCFALNGLLLYYLSVRDMLKVFRQFRISLLIKSTLVILPVIISIGVYIGRFQRWNSWDLLTDPFGPLRDVLLLIRYPTYHGLEWLFIVGFSLMLYMGGHIVKRSHFLNKLN